MTLSSDAATMSRPFPEKPVGIGGWLLFLVVSLTFLAPLLGLASTRMAISYAESANQTLADSPLWSELKLIQYGGLAIGSAISVAAGLLLIRSMKRDTPRRVIGLIVLMITVPSIAEYVAFNHVGPRFAIAMEGPIIAQLARGAVYALIWCSYLGISKRVRNTYVE